MPFEGLLLFIYLSYCPDFIRASYWISAFFQAGVFNLIAKAAAASGYQVELYASLLYCLIFEAPASSKVLLREVPRSEALASPEAPPNKVLCSEAPSSIIMPLSEVLQPAAGYHWELG